MGHTVKRWNCNGLDCVLREIEGIEKHFNGYVAIPKWHSLYGKHYYDDSMPSLDIHGGLTYAQRGLGDEPPSGDVWWFGFDTAHACDMRDFGGTPKSMQYVERETSSLAEQLSKYWFEPTSPPR